MLNLYGSEAEASLIGQNWVLASLLASQNRPGLLRALSRLKAGPYRYDKQQWEDEFASGGWDFLHNSLERHRNAVLAGCIDSYAPEGSVLEVGCGNGGLHQALRLNRHRSYLGVDVSETAIARANEAQDDRASFTVAPAETFEPPEHFDAIVFAETLYYLADPAAQAARYARSLNPGGFLFVSMALCGLRDGLWKLSIWQDLRERFETENEVDLYFPGNDRAGSVAWTVKVLKPRHPA